MTRSRDGAIVGTLALIVFLRVAGVSLLLPGFVAYATSLGGDVGLAGLAFAAYPLALALLMYPLASLSDRVGRRPVLAAGLVVSAIGGIFAAFAPSLLLLGAGRALQGAGAINGVALAVAGETGAPDRRARRMAALGAAAGGGFAVGLVAGALLTPLVGVPGVLLIHSAASLLLVVPVLRLIPAGAPPAEAVHVAEHAEGRGVRALAAGAFAVNFSLTGLLFLSPLLLEDAGAPYALLVTLMVLPAGIGIFLTSRLADKGHALAVGLAGAAALGLAPLAFLGLVTPGVALLVGAGIVYFIGHSALSALLPSLAAARAPAGRRGAAQGLQSTLQYLGSAAGAGVVGALYPRALPLALAFVASGLLVAFAVRRATDA